MTKRKDLVVPSRSDATHTLKSERVAQFLASSDFTQDSYPLLRSQRQLFPLGYWDIAAPKHMIRKIAKAMGITSPQMKKMSGIPIPSAKEDGLIEGEPVRVIATLVLLSDMAYSMVIDQKEMPSEALNFNPYRWLGKWIKIPQPALGGVMPIEMLSTQAGRDSVKRLLGAIQSGTYQ